LEGTHEENEGDISSRKLDEDKRLIDEVNVKMEEIEQVLVLFCFLMLPEIPCHLSCKTPLFQRFLFPFV